MSPQEFWTVVACALAIIGLTIWTGFQVEKRRNLLVEYAGPTDWFPAEIKPVHCGEYRVRLSWYPDHPDYAYWDGAQWRDEMNGYPCYFQDLEWHGLLARGEA
jgi:hypothetical protein